MEFRNVLLMIFIVALIKLVSPDDLCSCKHCEGSKVVSIQEDNSVENIMSTEENLMLIEDSDGDGSETICARERDHEDRSFPSICHMYCYNACTEFNVRVNSEQNGTYDVMAYRTNYYKLHDGPCPRHYQKSTT
ncbi:hypothetical protein PV325_002668 [Microctonus aethiopoides]|nr:hypothetical protein PV325_002668 [Microctonus aethiopoides]KAK0091926.1 hypothetical protein PV326_002517 [Microctonus aethiopoides]